MTVKVKVVRVGLDWGASDSESVMMAFELDEST